jgi:hypothetical protein
MNKELLGGCCQRCSSKSFLSIFNVKSNRILTSKLTPEKELDKCCLLCLSCLAAYRLGHVEFKKKEGLGYEVFNVK